MKTAVELLIEQIEEAVRTAHTSLKETREPAKGNVNIQAIFVVLTIKGHMDQLAALMTKLMDETVRAMKEKKE